MTRPVRAPPRFSLVWGTDAGEVSRARWRCSFCGRGARDDVRPRLGWNRGARPLVWVLAAIRPLPSHRCLLVALVGRK